MPNNHKLDNIDLDIIELLMEDGRMTCADIAKRIGNITARTVQNRMNSLLRRNIIQISAIPNPLEIGLPAIADVFIDTEPGRVYEVANELVHYDRISYVAVATGDSDISIQVVDTDVTELYKFVNDEIGQIPGVKNVSISIVPEILKKFGYNVKAILKKRRDKSIGSP